MSRNTYCHTRRLFEFRRLGNFKHTRLVNSASAKTFQFMARTDDTNPLFQQWDSDTQNVHFFQQSAPQQPTTILQQLSVPLPPAVSVRRGHIKEDLVELMMIQNAQMHQVIMNNMTMTALSSFGSPHPSSAPEASRHPVIVHEEDEEEYPMVYHHHYHPAPHLPYPSWAPPAQLLPSLLHPTPLEPLEPAPAPPSQHRNRRAVPPPPPPSATRTVGADIPPATEYYDATERR